MKWWLFLIFLGPTFVLAPSTATCRTWYVKPDSTGDAPTIQAAIDSASAGDDVLLAPGIYDRRNQGQGFLLEMKAGIRLHSEDGAESTVLDGELELGLQAPVMLCNDVGDQVIIEGLTISRGFGTGISVSGDSEPTIRSCVFLNNIYYGLTGGRGGAIRCDVATIEDCRFIGNDVEGGFGGAISCGAAQITNCVFERNGVGLDAGGFGGAIASNSATIRNCVFESNHAGDQITAVGGAIYDNGDPVIENCTFVDNFAGANRADAGAIWIRGSAGVVRDCVFVGNSARAFQSSPKGGAVYAPNGVSMTRCVFVNNTAGSIGNPGFGGAVCIDSGGAIEASTFLSNGSGDSGGVGGVFMNTGRIANVILGGTTSGAACGGTPGPSWSCSNLFDNATGDTICGADGGGNFSADPQFCAVDPEASLNFALQEDSPCAPGNHPDGMACGVIGAAGLGCGSTPVEHRTWSQIKSVYR